MPLKLRPSGLGSGIDKDRLTASLAARERNWFAAIPRKGVGISGAVVAKEPRGSEGYVLQSTDATAGPK
jgi:hypothetical protein